MCVTYWNGSKASDAKKCKPNILLKSTPVCPKTQVARSMIAFIMSRFFTTGGRFRNDDFKLFISIF